MNSNANVGPDPVPVFRLLIDLNLEDLKFLKSIFEMKKDVLRNGIEVKDPVGNFFHIRLFTSNRDVVMLDLIPVLVKFYSLSKKHYIYFTYEAGNKFKIKIKDEEEKEIAYPVPVVEEDERQDVVVISSDSEDEANGAMDEADGARAEGAGAGRHWFDKNISKTQAKGGQTLPLPRQFVRDFLKQEWTTLVVHSEDGKNYDCNLLWRAESGEDCHLRGEWYKFVKEMNLANGDKVHFESVENGINFVNTRVVRRVG